MNNRVFKFSKYKPIITNSLKPTWRATKGVTFCNSTNTSYANCTMKKKKMPV